MPQVTSTAPPPPAVHSTSAPSTKFTKVAGRQCCTTSPEERTRPFRNQAVLDAKGNLYGTTAGNPDQFQNGTVFELNPAGKMTVLHTFSGGRDGSFPNDLVRDHQGNL